MMNRRLLNSGIMVGPHRRRSYTPAPKVEATEPEATEPEDAPETPEEAEEAPEGAPEAEGREADEESGEEEPPAPPEAADPLPGPLTAIGALTEWVERGADPAVRAQAVIDQELGKAKKYQRASLLSKMQSIIDGSEIL